MTSMESYSTVRAGSFGDRFAAVLGLALALAVLGLSFRCAVGAACLARRRGTAPLAPERAEALVAAVRHTGRMWPFRVACAETSLASVLAAALLGRRLDWCLGVQFSPPPTAYHAWAALPEGQPVGEYTEGGWHYRAALVI
ncbi:lasso peptide biosynthesis B2 protein [Streptomyces olivoreticuli]|uniref:lasso peptide biosynthesis B2 protein n=1 Tax=Streptomyces olivoreticuli TaxID=68246 RepID=UPI001F082246|nr:lasso peptide biosynthesis B2 protein [Streptomyces olivoreticuli]